MTIKKYFNEHKAYFNLNCKEFGERRDRVCAFIVTDHDLNDKKNKKKSLRHSHI